MRIVVISDSHRRYQVIEGILVSQPDARHIFFLGDNTADIVQVQQRFPDRIFHIVAGNCDFYDTNPVFGIERLENIGIFYTHGHSLGVKGGTERLLEIARQRDCKIALYGHTHRAAVEYIDGVYLLNPGSCAQSREGKNSYMVVDIEKNGIMPVIIRI